MYGYLMKHSSPSRLIPKCPVKWRISDMYFDGDIQQGKGRLLVFMDMSSVDPRGLRVKLSDETKDRLLVEGVASMKLFWEMLGVDDARKLMCTVDRKSTKNIGRTGFWLDYAHPVDAPIIQHIIEICRLDGVSFRLQKNEMAYGKLINLEKHRAMPQTIAQLEDGLNSVIDIPYKMAKIPDPARVMQGRS